MNALIAELENAAEGSEKLDAQILAVLVGGFVEQSPFNGRWCVYAHDREGIQRLWSPGREDTFRQHAGYTTSLDAALTLVPEGLCWEVESGPKTGGVAVVGTVHGPMEGIGPTPVLALCIAALRARQAMEPV